MASQGKTTQTEVVRCTRCILPSQYPRISFDEAGVCSCCRSDKPYRVKGEEHLRTIAEEYRQKGGEHDCAVALSGGRDSTFVLYYVVKHLRLRPLAFTVDNDFMPTECVENVRKAVGKLGVDHVMLKHDLLRRSIRPVLSSWLHRQSPSMISMMCMGCRLGFAKLHLRVAKEHPELGLCFFGSGEPEQSFAMKFFSGGSSRWRHALGLATGISKEFMCNPRYVLRPSIPLRMVKEYAYVFAPTKAIQRLVYPSWRTIGLFHYIPWDEKRIMDAITGELGWRKYEHSAAAWRSDCIINLLKNALYLRTVGFSKNDELLSCMIRRGLITRDQALQRLAGDNAIPDEFFRNFCEDVHIAYERFMRSR